MSRAQSDQGFIKRLEEIIGDFPSRAALAKAASLPPSSLQSYIEGAEPTRPALVAIARAANISLEWLADNRGYKKPHPPVPDGYAEIPVYDIRKSGGYVYPLTTSDIASWIYLQLDWFNYPDMQPAKLFVVEAIRSLASGIKDGDLLVIDSGWQSRFAEGKATIPSGNYLISRQAKLFVREATASRSDTVEFVRPDAPGRKETFHVGEDGFAIHGRILWFGRTLALPKITRNVRSRANRTGNP